VAQPRDAHDRPLVHRPCPLETVAPGAGVEHLSQMLAELVKMHALQDNGMSSLAPVRVHLWGNSAVAMLQVQLTMLAVALLTTFPLLCSAAHLAHAPFADAVRAFAGAAEDFSGAVFPLPGGQQSAAQQCRQLHILVYVRPLCRAAMC